jgi:hypothetical protein
VIEALLVKKRKLKRVAEPTPPVVEVAVPVNELASPTVEPTSPIVKTTNVAGFLVARKKQALPPSTPRVKDVAAFLANEPVLVVPVNVVGLAEEPLRALEGPIL